jgi:hypothetical protein
LQLGITLRIIGLLQTFAKLYYKQGIINMMALLVDKMLYMCIYVCIQIIYYFVIHKWYVSPHKMIFIVTIICRDFGPCLLFIFLSLFWVLSFNNFGRVSSSLVLQLLCKKTGLDYDLHVHLFLIIMRICVLLRQSSKKWCLSSTWAP